jgi:hypothetical protein
MQYFIPINSHEVYQMERKKEKDYNAVAIGPTRTRFSDCCNQVIENNRCPQCGNWIEDNQGRRELKIKGLDGRSEPKPGTPVILFKSLGDKPKQEEKMPNYFKDMQQRGIQIRSWSASDSSA